MKRILGVWFGAYAFLGGAWLVTRPLGPLAYERWETAMYLLLGIGIPVAFLKGETQNPAEKPTWWFFAVGGLWLIACERLLWWRPGLWSGNRSFVSVLGVAGVFLLALLSAREIGRPKHFRRFPLLWDFAFAMGAMLWILRTPWHVQAGSVLHHWSFYLGPIESVRSGGWLLYDVPSQYGFLSILLPAVLPLPTVDAFFVCVGASVWACTLLSYQAFLRLGRGLRFRVWAAIVAFCGCILIPGWMPLLSGPLAFPSAGAYRFVWAIGFYCALNGRARILGWVCFAVGVFWSVESAFFCGSLLLAQILETAFGIKWELRKLSLSEPFTALGAALALAMLVTLFYATQLGQFPDWPAYWEFASLYGAGFGMLHISGIGSVHWLLGGYVLLAASSEQRLTSLALVFSTLSYFVWRSHESNATNLLPILLLALGAEATAGRVKAQAAWLGWWVLAASAVAACTIPVGAVKTLLHDFILRPRISVERELFANVDRDLERRVQAVANGRPFYKLVDVPLTAVRTDSFASSLWLSGSPWEALRLLPAERREVYWSRAIRKEREGGTLLIRRQDLIDAPRLRQMLAQKFREVRAVELSEELSLLVFEPR